MKLKALRNFKGPEGAFAIGETFDSKADRAKWLIDEAYAAKVETPAEAPADADAAPAAKAPAKRAK